MALEVDKPSNKLDGLSKEGLALGVKVAGLSFAYPGGTEVLNKVSFGVLAGSRVLLAGATGSGKSTLLRCLKPELAPHGRRSGEVVVDGFRVKDLNPQLSAGRIGFVLQDPHQQIVMDTVKAELAFGLENLGTPTEIIQRRIAEIANYFGIHSWVDRSTSDLSGGEKQLVNLAAIIAMQPRTLLLDEPTAALDPIASREFLELVQRVNDELGITVILVEHHQEDVLNRMNQVLYLEGGGVAFDGSPREFAAWLHSSGSPNRGALPVASKLFLAQPHDKQVNAVDIPLDVREGRWWLWQKVAEGDGSSVLPADSTEEPSPCAAKGPSNRAAYAGPVLAPSLRPDTPASCVLEAKNVWYRYSKEGPYVLKGLTMEVHGGSTLGIVGANASGKSTLLSLLTGAFQPQHGKIWHAPTTRLALLPQDPTVLFIQNTIQDELMEHAKTFGYGELEVEGMLERMRFTNKTGRHPFDLSGGEQQKLALAKLLLTNPSVLLLDEPTKGLDSPALEDLCELLGKLSAEGKTVVIVSHDLEFVAAAANECLMLFDGATVGRGSAKEFFAGNMFYTTALQRITQGILEGCAAVLPRIQEDGATRGAGSGTGETGI